MRTVINRYVQFASSFFPYLLIIFLQLFAIIKSIYFDTLLNSCEFVKAK